MLPFRRCPDAEHPAAADGERLHPGWIAQPVNTASSLAYVLAAAALIALDDQPHRGESGASRTPDGRDPRREQRAFRLALATALAANGLGSMGFHGPGDRISHRIHDWSLWSIVGIVGIALARGLTGNRRPADQRVGPLRRLAGPAGALAVGAVLNQLSRTPGGRATRPGT